MVEIEDERIARFVLRSAKAFGTWGDVMDTASEGKYGQHEHDTEWSLDQIDPEDCFVEVNGNTLVVGDIIDAEYSVKTTRARRNPPGKAHPAEYERRTRPLGVTMEMPLDSPAQVEIHAEPV